MKRFLDEFDVRVITVARSAAMPLARLALFVIFFWFGILKVLQMSPAESLVASLLEETIPVVPFSKFIVWFGVYEMVIGAVFLVPHLERLAIALLVPHMVTTFMPLVLLPQTTWQGFLIPTLEGQYIIKNLAIIALALALAAKLEPFHLSEENKV